MPRGRKPGKKKELRVVVVETDIPAPPGPSGLDIMAKWIARDILADMAAKGGNSCKVK